MRSRRSFLIAAAGFVSAAFAYFGTGLHPIWWALWLAPIPVLAISPGLRGSTAFLLAAFAWLIAEMNQWNYVRHAIELPPQITVLYFVVPAVVFGLGVLFVRNLLRRGSLFLASLALPVYWVAYEYLTAITSPHSTWGSLAYTQMNCLPVIQVAAITGLWGISFIVFLFAAAVVALLSGAGGPWQRRAVAVAVGFVVCAVFVFGKWRLQSNPPAQTVAVTLIAKDVPMSVYLGSEEQALRLLGEYAAEIPRMTPAGTFNSSRLYSADGKLEANYDKHHLIPGVEREKPGDKPVVLDEPSGRWGLQICKDMDFPKLSREYATEGANLLLVPA